MCREKKGNTVLIIFILMIMLISIKLIYAFPACAQFYNMTFTPLNTPFAYGGTLNPFFPGLDSMFSPLNFNSFGLGYPFFNLNPHGNGIFSNPLNSLFNPVISPFSFLDSLSSIPGSLTLPQISFGGLTMNPIMSNLLMPTIHSLAAPLSMRMAAQAGTWIGTWQSTFIAFIILFNSGTMNMTLIENPTLNTLDGTAILVGSRFADTLFDVRGVLTDPTSFILEGIVAPGNALVLNCILTSPTTMTGSYTVSFGFGGQVVDTGVFNLTLV